MKNTTLLMLLSLFIISCGEETRTPSSKPSSEEATKVETISVSSTSKTENVDICRCLIEPGNTQWYKDNANTCRDAISEKIGVPNWETINFSQNPMLDAKWEELKTSCGH